MPNNDNVTPINNTTNNNNIVFTNKQIDDINNNKSRFKLIKTIPPHINTTTSSSSSCSTNDNQVCKNCLTTNTPLWRRDDNGSILCNACGLFLKLHGKSRPISLKTDIIKPRNRNNNKLTSNNNSLFNGNIIMNTNISDFTLTSSKKDSFTSDSNSTSPITNPSFNVSPVLNPTPITNSNSPPLLNNNTTTTSTTSVTNIHSIISTPSSSTNNLPKLSNILLNDTNTNNDYFSNHYHTPTISTVKNTLEPCNTSVNSNNISENHLSILLRENFEYQEKIIKLNAKINELNNLNNHFKNYILNVLKSDSKDNDIDPQSILDNIILSSYNNTKQ